jgi:glycosyltransferase involved in cell wall biosynthesis
MVRSARGVTVVIPTKDRLERLERTVRTVLCQQGVDLEVVIVDDGSTEEVTPWVTALGDRRVRCLRNDHSLGVAGARNRGLANARHEWIAFLDDDDLWSPLKLGAQLSALAERPDARWCLAGAAVVDDDLRLLRVDEPPAAGDARRTLLFRNAVPGGCSGVLVARSLLEEVGGFDERLSMMADWDLWIRCALASPVASVTAPLVIYVQHGANMSHDGARSDQELALVLAKHHASRRHVGVSGIDVGTQRWIARNAAVGGARRDASRRYVSLAWQTHRPGMLRLALRSLIGPRWFRAATRRDARRLPSERRQAALRAVEEIQGRLSEPAGGARSDRRD